MLEELKRRSDVDLHVIIAGTAILPKYSAHHAHVKEMLTKDGFNNIYEVYFNLEGDKPIVKAKSTGLGIIEFSSLYDLIGPELVVVRGDRFETLAAASAAALMNITVAHIEGGDVSGTLDEAIRHSITKLSHIHFATNDASRNRIIQMGEHPDYVFNFGSPDLEVVMRLSKKGGTVDLRNTGSGAAIDPSDDYIIVSYHPVTTELEQLAEYTKALLGAVHELKISAFWFWPNFDAGAEEKISRELRVFNNKVRDHKIRFMRYLPPQDYLILLRNARCFVGNSSSGLKECSYLGIPVVNIGSRQKGRARAEHVLDVVEDKKAIMEAVKLQLSHGPYNPSLVCTAKNTSRNIAKTLATVNLYIQKSFKDLK